MNPEIAVEILETVRLSHRDSNVLSGYNIDRPRKGETYNSCYIPILGWVMGKAAPVSSIQVSIGDRAIQTIPVDRVRKDVDPVLSKVGFEASFDIDNLHDSTSELRLFANFADGRQELISIVKTSKLPSTFMEIPGPDFIIIGAMKAATSAIYDYIGKHPRAISRYPKELHFFTLHFDKGLDWYREQFDSVRLNSKGEKLLTGEGSPTYLIDPNAPSRIMTAFPNVKIIACLRNPSDRSISQYYHQVNRVKDEQRSIEEAFSAEELAKLPDRCQSATQHYILNGLYAQHLKNWFQVCPKEQMLILNYHDLETQPDRFIERLFSFLDLQDFLLTSLEKIYENKYPAPPVEVKQRLDEFFKPYNQELESLLEMQFNW
jgi:Sulfotransferase domain